MENKTLKHRLHPLVMIIYPARVIGYFLCSLAVFSILYKYEHSMYFWCFFVVNMFVWPHIAFLISRISSRAKSTEYAFLGVDSLMFGIWIGNCYFNPWIFLAFVASSLTGNVGLNGFNLSSKCLAMLVLGMIISGYFNDFQFVPETGALTIILSMLALGLYPCYTGFLVYSRSLTLNAAKKNLTEANNNIKRINRIVNAASVSVNINEMMRAVLPVLQELFLFDFAIIQLADREEGILQIYSVHGKYITDVYSDRIKKLKIHINGRDSLTAKVLHDKKTIYIPVVTPETEFYPIDREIYDSKAFLSIVMLPIILNEESIGVITFFSCFGYFELSEHDIELIKQYIAQISIVIKNSFLYHKITEDQNLLNEKNKQLENISSQLSHYLSPQIYEMIFSGKSEVKIESHFKPLSIFFSDIAGFTALTDRIESEVLTSLLNRYLTVMSEIAIKHGGTIDKYIGDAILIFFGDPDTRGEEQDALECVLMALEMQEKLKLLYKEWEDEGFPDSIKIRIGINSGLCAVGNFGSKYRMNYSIMGFQVNIAIRLEAQGVAGEIIISESTYHLIKKHIKCIEYVAPASNVYSQPIVAYQVIG